MLKVEKNELEKKLTQKGSFNALSEIELIDFNSTETGKEEFQAIKEEVNFLTSEITLLKKQNTSLSSQCT